MAKQKVYTKRCEDGTACGWAGEPAFVADDVAICDGCLLQRFGPMRGDSNVCLDPLGMDTWYREDEVVAALRRATEL